MKKILLSLILLVAAAAGGSYFMWDSYVTNNKDKLDKAFKEQLAQMPELNVTYDVETSGYPLAAKLTYSNIRSQFTDPETGITFTATMNSPIVASASIFSPNQVVITSENALINVDFPEDMMEKLGEESMPITFSMGWDKLVSKHHIDNMNSGEAIIDNMNFTAGAEAMPMKMSIAKILSRRNIEEKHGLVSGTAYARMDDMNVSIAVINVPISVYEIDASFAHFPVAKELQDLSRKLQLKSGENVTEEEFEQIIAVAKGMVQKMIDNGSSLNINTLRVESDALQFNLDGGVEVTSDALLEGEFNMNLSGIEKFVDMLPDDHPSKQMAGMASMMSDGENLELSLGFKDGMVVFNGAPVLPIPPINTLLDHIKYPEGGIAPMGAPNMNSPLDMPTAEMHEHMDGDMPTSDMHNHMDGLPELEGLSIEIQPMQGISAEEYDAMNINPEKMSITEEMPEMASEEMEMPMEVEDMVEEEKPDFPQSEADFEVTEQDLQKMLMEIDETLKDTNLP